MAESVGDQFVFSNILPKTMSRVELYKGYRRLIAELYEFRNFRRRTLDFILNRGRQIGDDGTRVRKGELALLARILKDTVLAASPRRAWFTLSLIGATLWKHPRRVTDAVSFAIVHKGLYEYMQSLDHHLERVIREIEQGGDLALAPARA